MTDGAVVRIRRHGNPEGPRLVLCHGNGFAIDAYFPFWRHLTARFDLVLYDQRNHGQNPRHQVEAHDLPAFVNDMERVFWGIHEEFGRKPAVGVFHSISGVTSVWHALQYAQRWDALVLFDPAFIPGPGLPEHETAQKFELMLAGWARDRPSRFADPTELAGRFSKSYSLRRWVPGGHLLMARSILHQEPDGAWTLCCPPAGESQVYATNARTHLTHRLRELPMPLQLICADADQPDAQAPCKVGRSLHAQYACRYHTVADTSHLLQIEKPEECVRALLSFLDELRIGR
ncbi:MAG: alpha/beta hydrolase [Hyphomicrobiales bacterium]|nr:alpha/beta hydrolase [Hyphomicrobiales bacterium]